MHEKKKIKNSPRKGGVVPIPTLVITKKDKDKLIKKYTQHLKIEYNLKMPQMPKEKSNTNSYT